MNQFLELFGDLSIGWAVAVIAAIVFLVACYKKVEKFFSDKAISEKEKDERIQQVIEQAEKYPIWHEQSIQIRDNLKGSIDDLGNRFDEVKEMIYDLKKENSEDRATDCRYRILRFNDEILHDIKHTKEHFDQVLEDITDYEKYCKEHPDYKNNKAVFAISNIEKTYQKCSEDGTFL